MKKILIIEDNELNLKLMKDVLESQEFEVFSASNGREGLEKAQDDSLALILLDIQMPEVSGYDFLQAYDGKTPIIVVSACAMDVEIKKALDLGCAGYIAKPININEFLQTVKQAIG